MSGNHRVIIEMGFSWWFTGSVLLLVGLIFGLIALCPWNIFGGVFIGAVLTTMRDAWKDSIQCGGS